MPNKEEQLQEWKKAGKIAAKVREFAKGLVKKDASLLGIVEQIEEKIYSLDARPAFPVNIGLNEKAAHFTPFHNDKTMLAEDLVKIDLGVAIDGLLTDTAFTVDLTKQQQHKKMIKVTEKALAEAIKLATPHEEVRKIGRRVHETITQAGFSPVRNLSGHEIWPYKIHAGLSIPNYDNNNSAQLQENMIIAIEPFATTGEGLVKEGKESGDYGLIEKKPVRESFARELLHFIDKEYSTMPFASRWIFRGFGLRGLQALKILEQQGIVKNYKELVEVSSKPVTHFEHTILVKEKPEILTEE